MKLGIHPRTLCAPRDEALLERLDRDLYRVADAKPLGNPDFVTVALKVPRGVICLISALASQRFLSILRNRSAVLEADLLRGVCRQYPNPSEKVQRNVQQLGIRILIS